MSDNSEKKQFAINLTKLIELAREGRKEVLPVLRQALDQKPELWKHYGNIGLQAQAAWLSLIAGENLYLKESLERFAADLRENLAGPDASPLERLQAERIVALNLQVGYYEAMLARYEGTGAERIVAHLLERSSVADGRLARAMTNLARIRKLLPQTLHVNLAISGEVQTTVRHENDEPENRLDNGPVRLRVPQNRVKDLLDAARN